MNFFENQQRARRATGWLVFLYLLSVVCITGAIHAGLMVIQLFSASEHIESIQLATVGSFFYVSALVIGLIGLGTLYKIYELSSGGKAVAEMLGAALLQRNSSEQDERKVLNVVEEMAIASGLPVPPIFLIEDQAINAFAAGLTPASAVIGVTRGCIQQLNRDQLQGVIAHEFSHIFNGDMRLNIRLLGLLHGILVLALTGNFLFRSGARSDGRRRGSKREGRAGLIILVGLLLYVVGYIGVFFARLIQSAVSRQREFLADASAVQFTRNPAGIGGALRKILSAGAGSRLENVNASEVSHFFFANGVREALLGFLSTHPPLKERIMRIDPSLLTADLASLDESPVVGPVQSISNLVGTAPAGAIERAKTIMEEMPPKLRELINEPTGARAVIFALLLNREPAVRNAQLSLLNHSCDALLLRDLNVAGPLISSLDRRSFLPIVSASLASMRAISARDYLTFRRILRRLVQADKTCSIFEYALQRMLQRHLDTFFFRTTAAVHARRPWQESARDLVAALASLTHSSTASADQALSAGLLSLGIEPRTERPSCGLKELDSSLSELEGAAPQIKSRIVDGCMAAIKADREISVEEIEILRAVCDGIDCPLPLPA